MSSRKLSWAFSVAAFLLSSCGGGGGGGDSPPPTQGSNPPPPPPVLVITATSPVQLGTVTSGFRKLETLAVVVKDDKGNLQPNTSVKWVTNDPTSWTYPSQSMTDANGAAQVYWVAGESPAAEVIAIASNSASSSNVKFTGNTVLPATPPAAGHRWDIYFDTQNKEAANGFRLDATIEAEAPTTYFSTLGWFGGPGSVFGGYMGLQRDGDLFKSQLQFSVWDGATVKATVVKVTAPGARCDPFGGEGNGIKCRMDYPWAAGDSFQFEVQELVVNGLSQMTAFATNKKTGVRTEIATLQQGSKSDMTSTVGFIEPFVVPAAETTCAKQALRTMRMENVQYLVGGTWKPFTSGLAAASEPTTSCANGLFQLLPAGGLRLIAGGTTSGGNPVSYHYFSSL